MSGGVWKGSVSNTNPPVPLDSLPVFDTDTFRRGLPAVPGGKTPYPEKPIIICKKEAAVPKALKPVLAALAMLVIAPVLTVAAGKRRFRRKVAEDIHRMFADQPGPRVMGAVPEYLPEPVRRYLEYAMPLGPRPVSRVRLTQRGEICLDTGQPWIPVAAEQQFAVNRPGFVWSARAKVSPFLWIDARDRYDHGTGNMLIRLWSAFTLADVSGPEMDVSSLLRWLSEAVWFPEALLPGEHLSWEAADDTSARAIVRDSGISASLVFHFAENGAVESMVTTERYRDENGSLIRRPWTLRVWNWGDRDGVRIPVEGTAEWNLPDEDFVYFKAKIEDIRYGE